MNRSIFENEAPNPWKNRESLPYPKQTALIPMAVMYLLSSLELVFFANERFSMIVFAALCAGVLLVVRMPRGTVGLLITAIIPVVLLRSFAIGALALSVVVGVGCAAMLVTSMRRPWQAILLPAIAWTVAYVLTKDAGIACYTLLLLPAAALLTVSTLTDQRRSTSICYTLFGLLLSVLALYAAYLLRVYGTIDRNVLFTFFEEQRLWVTDVILLARDEVILAIRENLGEAQSAETVNMLMNTLSREGVTNLVAAIYNVLPALIVVGCSILAFESQSFLCGMYYTHDMKAALTPNATMLTLSVVSAGIYLFSFFVMMFAGGTSLFVAVVQNCYLILTPGLFLMGIASARAQMRMNKGGSRLTYIVIAVLVIALGGPTAIISLLAFSGAVMVILSNIGMMMIKRMQDRMGSQMPPNFDAWSKGFGRGNGFGADRAQGEEPAEDSKEEYEAEFEEADEEEDLEADEAEEEAEDAPASETEPDDADDPNETNDPDERKD